jgi:hypothetical protein
VEPDTHVTVRGVEPQVPLIWEIGSEQPDIFVGIMMVWIGKAASALLAVKTSLNWKPQE